MIFLFFLIYFFNIFCSEKIEVITLKTNEKEDIFEKIYINDVKNIYDLMQPGGEIYEFLILINDKINENFLTEKKEKIEKLMEFQKKIKNYIEKFEFVEDKEKINDQLELLKFTYYIIETIKMSFVIFDKKIHFNKLKNEFDKKNFIRDKLFKNLETEFFVEKKIIFEDNKNNFKKNKTIEDLNEKLNINDLFTKNLNEEKTIKKANLIKKKSENYLSQSLKYLENYYNSSINYMDSLFKKKQNIKKEKDLIEEKIKNLEKTSLSTIDEYKKSSQSLLEISKNLNF